MQKPIPGSYPHSFWLDITNNGVLTEVVILKEDKNGDIYFIPLKSLDNIDLQRIGKILASRNAKMFPLYELMAQTTLGNGMNALLYFQQLVKMRTASGQVVPASANLRGAYQPMVQQIPATESTYATQQVTNVDPTAMLAEAQQTPPRRGRPAGG